MRLYEIQNKYFFIEHETVCLLESYTNPDHELTIEFEQVPEWPSSFYAVVREVKSKLPVVRVTFTLVANQNIDIGNIEPNSDLSHNKLVHTSFGVQDNGVDMGYVAIKWLYRKIKEFAISKGFNVQTFSSASRYTGARAKNNPGVDDSGLPRNFNVPPTKISEAYIYNCITDELIIKRSIIDNKF